MRKLKYIITYVMLSLVLTVLCSCGVKEEEEQSRQKETVEVVKPAVTSVFKNSETTEKVNKLANDDIRVWENYDNFTWMQEKLDGTERKTMEDAGLKLEDGYSYDVEWLTNDWVYLTVWEDLPKRKEDSQYIFCRIPVLAEEETVYDTANKEILFQLDVENAGDANTIYDFIVTDSYILYRYWACANDPHEEEYYCYDFRTKKTSLAFSMDADAWIEYSNSLPITANNCFFLQDGRSIYSVSFDTFEKKKIEPKPENIAVDREFLESLKNRETPEDLEDLETLEYDDDREVRMTVYDGSLYFRWGFSQVFQYDGNSVNCVIDGDTFSDQIEALKAADTGYIYDIYIWNDKLYIYIQGFYDSGKRRTVDILVSADCTDLKQWTLEGEFMDYIMKNNCDTIYNPDFVWGKFFFSTDDEVEYLAYDLETKKIEEGSDIMLYD